MKPASPEQSGPTILLVDDESAVRKMLTALLSDCGYRVLETASPDEALRLVAAEQIDLVVNDVQMPLMSGPQLARAIREINPGIRVLFMSGNDRSAELDTDQPLWGAAFIMKPFSLTVLTRTIRDLLDVPETGIST